MAAVALSLSVPAVVQLRQASALQALRALLPKAPWLGPGAAESLMDVKAAMRHALTQLLAAELDMEVHRNVTDAQIMRIVHEQRQGPGHFSSAIAKQLFARQLAFARLCGHVLPGPHRAHDLSGILVTCPQLPPCLAHQTGV